MAVINYDGVKNIHPAGFIGSRVATTVGYKGTYRQKYFSMKRYGDDAVKLAEEQDRIWRNEADKVLRRRRIFGPKVLSNKNTLTGFTGLTLRLNMHHGIFSDSLSASFVTQRRREGHLIATKSFTVAANGGLRAAWLKVCKEHRDLYELTPVQYTYIRRCCPDAEDVCKYLLRNAKKRGIALTRKQVMSWLFPE